MKQVFQPRAWHYYAITFVLITVLFLLRDTAPRSVGLAGRYGLSPVTLVLAILISFVVALYIGLKNVRLKCLYPLFTALFAYLLLPLIAFFACYRHVHGSSDYYFAYYVGLGFIYIFLPYILVTFFGLGLGVLIRKIQVKKGEDTK